MLAASLTVGNILAMRYCLRHYRRKVMNEILGYCEHMISSQATCKTCAIKLEARIKELRSDYLRLEAELVSMGYSSDDLCELLQEQGE